MYSFPGKYFLVGFLALLSVGVFGFYQYRENRLLEGDIAALENQLTTVASLSHEQQNQTKETLSALALTAKENTALKSSSTLAMSAKAGSEVSQEQRLTTAVAKAAPAVVSVVISKDVPKLEVHYENPFGNDPLYQDFGARFPVYRQIGTERQQIGAGTGFLVREDGYIMTNRHVVADPNAEYTVLLSNGQQKTARVVYLDQSQDLAIIKIDGNKYPIIPMGDSSVLKLGQTVAAIGNALGEYNNSVSVGIISGLNRQVEALDQQTGTMEKLSGVIQTDAAINVGNSGGPLLNLSGEGIGVNVVTAQGVNNIAFSIPINAAKDVLHRAGL